MKKKLIFPLLLVLVLSGCSINGSNKIQPSGSPDEASTTSEVEGAAIASSTEDSDKQTAPADNVVSVNKSISSDRLGIKVGYYSSSSNEVFAREVDNRIYFYNKVAGDDYKSGQYLEMFNKSSEISLKEAIEDNFLNDIERDKCFVTITKETDEYQMAVIDFPDTPCPNDDMFCNSCPKYYSRTNGIAYFIAYKNNPLKYFYFSIGQYSLVDLTDPKLNYGDLEWFNNLEFIE